jgi:hypothetical protein
MSLAAARKIIIEAGLTIGSVKPTGATDESVVIEQSPLLAGTWSEAAPSISSRKKHHRKLSCPASSNGNCQRPKKYSRGRG